MSGRLVRAALAVALLAAPVAAQQQAQIRLDLSPAGEAVVKRYLAAPDLQLQALAKRANDNVQRQKMLVTAPKLDLIQLATALREREQLQSQITRRSNDRMLQMLRELNEADRVAFMRGMSNPIPMPAPPKK